MTSYEKLTFKSLLRVKCQYDYEKVSANQCSWYAFCILDEIKKMKWILPNPIGSSSVQVFERIISDSLVRASDLRKKYGKHSWGENIYSKEIIKMSPQNISLPRISLHNDTPENTRKSKMLFQDLMLYLPGMKEYYEYKEKIPKKKMSEFRVEVKNLEKDKSYLLVNRFGESFLIFPKIGDPNKFYIFDSHVRDFGIFTGDKVMDYVIKNYEEHVEVIWMKGFMNNVVAFKDPKEIDMIFF